MTSKPPTDYAQGYQQALSDIATKLAFEGIPAALVWCADNSNDRLDATRFKECLDKLVSVGLCRSDLSHYFQ